MWRLFRFPPQCFFLCFLALTAAFLVPLAHFLGACGAELEAGGSGVEAEAPVPAPIGADLFSKGW